MNQNGIDINMLTRLMRWTDFSLSTIGRGKLEEALDLYALTGKLSDNIKEIILKIADMSFEIDIVDENKKATIEDYITVVTKLNEAITNQDDNSVSEISSND